MKKTVIVALSILLMLTAFTACNPNNDDVADENVLYEDDFSTDTAANYDPKNENTVIGNVFKVDTTAGNAGIYGAGAYLDVDDLDAADTGYRVSYDLKLNTEALSDDEEFGFNNSLIKKATTGKEWTAAGFAVKKTASGLELYDVYNTTTYDPQKVTATLNATSTIKVVYEVKEDTSTANSWKSTLTLTIDGTKVTVPAIADRVFTGEPTDITVAFYGPEKAKPAAYATIDNVKVEKI